GYGTLPYEVVWEPDAAPPGPAYEVVDVVEAALVELPEIPWQPRNRRQLFARLAAIRRFLAAWGKLRATVADPREPLDRPARVLTLLEAVAEALPLLGT